MEPIKNIDRLGMARRHTATNNGSTKLSPSQPLNEIGGDRGTFYDVLKGEFDKVKNELGGSNEDTSPNQDTEDEYEKGYSAICEICQIQSITGSCQKCGLYQYGQQFDIMTRRRQ